MNPTAMRLPLLLVAALLLTGCASFEMTSVRSDLARQMPEAEIADGRSFSFGFVSLGLARLATGIIGEGAAPARTALRGVRKVKFGRYDVTGSVDATQLAMPTRLRRYVDRGGWTHLATVRDDSEAVWVLYRARGDRITDLFVTVLSDDELVVARVSGDLTRTALGIVEHMDVRVPVLDLVAADY